MPLHFTNAQPLKYITLDALPCFLAYLYAETRFHQMKLIHQLLVERSHVLGNKLLMHSEAVLQNVCLQNKSWLESVITVAHTLGENASAG